MVLRGQSASFVAHIKVPAYRKWGEIHWAKLSRFSRFSVVLRKFSSEYKCLSLVILNNEYLRTAYGQGNAKIFLQ